MSSRRVTPWVVLALAAAGAGGTAWRLHGRGQAPLDREDTFWRLRYDVEFVADQPGARLRLAYPFDTRHGRVFHREAAGQGLTVRRVRPDQPVQAREIVAIAKQAGRHRLTADFDLHLAERPAWRANTPDAVLSDEARAEYLRSEPDIQADSPAVLEALAELQSDAWTQSRLVRRIFDFCAVDLEAGGPQSPRNAAAAIESREAGPPGRARAMIALCRAAGIPARLVSGFEVKRAADIRPRVWVEVRSGSRWEPYDPDHGLARQVPRNLLPVRYGALNLFRSKNVSGLRSKLSLMRLPPPEGVSPPDARRFTDVLDLTRLPVEMHPVLSLLLLMPFGALATSVVRTVIGIRTFGTFTPALLALSFIFADWRTGLMIFAAVLAVGLASRGALDRLKLLVVPRLSVMLTLVVLTMVLGVAFLDHWGWTPGAEAVLLPMVIMTMTVERFYVNAEQDGLGSALKLLAGTLLVASFCYLLLRWEAVGQIILICPEAHLVTIAALVLLGRYTGYRLTELWRFRDVKEPSPWT